MGPARLSHAVYKKLAIGSTAAYSLVLTLWYTSNMSNAILPHTFAVFAVGSTLVYCYDLRPMYNTKKYYIQEE